MALQFSIVIPVWNGAEVIGRCLDAIYSHRSDQPLEVICVENASRDESAQIIGARFPQVKRLSQPVNLGFAGGVNVGIRAAQGEVMVLLNQDCLPQPGWLSALSAAFEAHTEFGIAGCTLYSSKGQLDHAGARLLRPSALGEHLTEVGREPRCVEYVTGAAMAIRRSTFDRIGLFDEGYYPAYFEEADFCWRARRQGIETGYVPAARLTHLRNSLEAQSDLIKHWANQQRMRYRFIIKQFDAREIGEFLAYELAAAGAEQWFDQAVGRVMGARDTLRGLPDIFGRRHSDGNAELPPAVRRQLEVGLTAIMRRSFAVAEGLGAPRSTQVRNARSGSRWLTSIKHWLRRWDTSESVSELGLLKQQLAEMHDEFERRVRLLEILADYEYR